MATPMFLVLRCRNSSASETVAVAELAPLLVAMFSSSGDDGLCFFGIDTTSPNCAEEALVEEELFLDIGMTSPKFAIVVGASPLLSLSDSANNDDAVFVVVVAAASSSLLLEYNRTAVFRDRLSDNDNAGDVT